MKKNQTNIVQGESSHPCQKPVKYQQVGVEQSRYKASLLFMETCFSLVAPFSPIFTQTYGGNNPLAWECSLIIMLILNCVTLL